MLVQPEAGEDGHDDVAEGCGREDEGDVGPAESGHVTGHEAEEDDDAGDDPGTFEGEEEGAEVVEGDRSQLLHADAEKSIADGGAEHDGDENEPAAGGEGVLHTCRSVQVVKAKRKRPASAC